MATAERAFEVALGFSKERAGDVEVGNGFVKGRAAGHVVEVGGSGFVKTGAGHAGNVEVASGFDINKKKAGNVEIASNGFTTKEKASDVEVANAFLTAKDDGTGNVEVATNGVTTTQQKAGDDAEVIIGNNNGVVTTNQARTGDDAEVLHDFSPLLVVYKSGRLERPLILPLVPPGHDAATGVVSKDVPLSGGSTFVRLRLYLPPIAAAENAKKKKKKLPVVVYFHGGGFVIGSAATCVYHRTLNDLSAACPAVAVSVDYRLAPEHLLPAAYDDSLAALKWVLAASDPWLAAHADMDRVFLAGDSAGGNICHHLAMHPDVVTRGLMIKGVVLIHPWFWGKEPIDGERAHRRSSSSGKGRGRKTSLWEYVCPDARDGVDDPRMNPTTGPGAAGLERLACEKVMVCVAEGDHLRWRGKAYAAAAARAGKEVETVESAGVGHVFYLLDPDMDEAREMIARIAGFVNNDPDRKGAGDQRDGAAAATTAKSCLTIE
ncbi:hypothetical protein PR202_gb15474 [Eleusine coracana subsp. coracana]|uniref:Alpha/beta hydrolase fold-3 domain-containing protein n=1 Tax=Eleusine coracana subsp. coracana TaxID=191504 RepID=A0AAV5EY35_ELECO|nr:hypothetical protein PR202_gb15474 [Eleusine coracana subsp. coracana]